MSAETRTLIAIFLIVLISIISYKYLPRQQAQPPLPVESEEPHLERVMVERVKPTELKAARVAPTADEDSVLIETDLHRICLSSVGGSIKSLRLKEYADLRGKGEELKAASTFERIWALIQSMFRRREESQELAELIPEGRRAVLSTVRTSDGTFDLANHNFTIETTVHPSGAVEGKVVFAALLPDGSTLRKTYTFRNGDYIIGLEEICPGSAKELILDWGAGLRQTEKAQRGYLNYFSAMAMVGGMFKQWQLTKAVKVLRSGEIHKIRDLEYVGRVDWGAVKTKYFLACFIPKREVRYFRVDTVGPSIVRIGARVDTVAPTELSVRMMSEGNRAEYDIYVGPIQYDRLREFDLGLQRAVYLGPGWVSGISRLILRILVWLHKLVHNYGVVIILFSCIMMVIFYPLTFKSLRSMREMQKLQPKIAALKQKYKKDPKRLNTETMGIYKKEGINPLGGCLPLLFQMPVFWALFAILRSMIELRGANFLWIADLSERDPTFILPVLMAGSMFVQQKFTPTDPRQKAMTYMMPMIMLFIFWSFPAGLVLYWFIYNVLSVVQHYILHKRGEEPKTAS
ncbi:membrane protein insertase YidC [candidate division TA06 bacterium]|uniref:Membrane protein insertase YidC n=1 Tax=candidate division TA06 bacterium TaxID=2250710 RepID=A0A523UZ93_UNCT6|nr:MAG: membrane protein insertase YidC [candidate division TA06 bacterium]